MNDGRLKLIRAALELYGDDLNWRKSMGLEYERGAQARAALKALDDLEREAVVRVVDYGDDPVLVIPIREAQE